ncbi:MAG: SpoIIE family protein phosphatase [Desulfohalobiaceae bacterium]|nr:SpoIIE family protein phosphatase [Desulfohalobiaceae bacterium]
MRPYSIPQESPGCSLAFSVTEQSRIAEVRRKAVNLARKLGFSEDQTGKTAIVVTEAGTNLLKHARSGELLLDTVQLGQMSGLRIVAIDKGPGMQNVGQCLQDGFSSTGSPGTGLGAMRRLSSQFDIHSLPDQGTVLMACLRPKGGLAKPSAPGFEVAGICLPKPGQSVCGDNWALQPRPNGWAVLVADGLGHGPGAAEASLELRRIFQANPGLDLQDMMQRMQAGLRGTRGAAAAVAEMDRQKREVRFVGLGNISACLLSGSQNRHLVSRYGIVGRRQELSRVYVTPWPEREGGSPPLLVMHSDGLKTGWSLDPYPGLVTRHPALIAGVLYRDYQRDDDLTVVVGRVIE